MYSKTEKDGSISYDIEPFYYTFSNYAIKRFIETARFMVTEHFIAINRYMQITAYFAFIDFNLRSKR